MDFFDLQLNQLRSFLIVAESRSFSAAAEKLYISHTALIQQMNSLEKQLGFSLFIRSPRGISLTESGAYLCQEVRKLGDYGRGILAECAELDRGSSRLKIGNINDLHTFYFYAEFYRTFRRDHPDITIEFAPTVRTGVLTMCQNSEIDVGFYFGTDKQEQHPDLIFNEITIRNMAIMMSPRNPLASMGWVQSGVLEGRTIYAIDVSYDDLIYDQVKEITAGKLELIKGTMQTIYDICARGGLILLPIWFEPQFPNLKFLPFEPAIPFHYQVVTRPGAGSAVKEFVQCYMAYDASL